MNIKRTAVRGIAWIAFQRGGTHVVSFIVITVLSRLLDPDAFGLVAIAMVFVGFVQIFLDQGFGTAIIQRNQVDEEHLNTAFWSGLVVGGLMTIAGLGLAGVIASLYQEPTLAPVIRILSINFIILALSNTQRAILSRELAFDRLAIRTLIAEVVGGAIGILMAIQGYGVWSLIGRNLARDFTGVIVLWGVSRWRPGLKVTKRHFMEMFEFGINIVGERTLYFVNRNVDKLIIGYFLGTTVVGYYSMGLRLIQLIVKLFFETIANVVFPVFSRIQKEQDRIRNAFFQAVKSTSLLSFPTFIGISLLSSEIILTLFGSKWAPSIVIMRIVAFTGVIYGMTYYIPQVILAAGKPAWCFRIASIRIMISLAAILLGIQWGINGVAIGIVVSNVLVTPIYLWTIHRLYNINIADYLRQFIPALLGSILLTLVILVTRNILFSKVSAELSLAINISIGILVYLASIHKIDSTLITQVVDFSRFLLPRRDSN